jgi:glycosyltransferase involved in cell wall biosynthesis
MPLKPKVHVLIPTFQPNDAVGNDVLGMYHCLRASGYQTEVYAQFVHPQHQSITRTIDEKTSGLWNDPNDILIYHHAIDWELGENILARTKCKIVIKYHNVTPAHFYKNYAEHYYWACIRGIEATERLAKIPNTWIWGDSAYNAQEFIDLGVAPSRCRVVAPIHRVEDLASKPFDSVVAGIYRGTQPNIIFVGGIRPNKGHTKALEVFSTLRSFSDTEARLLFVGNHDPNLGSYMDELKQYIAYLELQEGQDVIFATSVSPSQLRAYYMTASTFLCVSEHEGFCVPLVEAMAFRVPIVAWSTTAVGETAGGCGWITEEFDSQRLAEGIAEYIENSASAREAATRGRERYETHFHVDAINNQLLRLVEEVAST